MKMERALNAPQVYNQFFIVERIVNSPLSKAENYPSCSPQTVCFSQAVSSNSSKFKKFGPTHSFPFSMNCTETHLQALLTNKALRPKALYLYCVWLPQVRSREGADRFAAATVDAL